MKRIILVKRLMILFLFYMAFLILLIPFSLFNDTIAAALDLLLYFGNVIGVGCSFYIMSVAYRFKLKLLFAGSIFILIINAHEVVMFLAKYT